MPRSVGEDVRAFYERHPYPPPVDSLEKYRRLGQDRQKRRADYHLFWPARPYREDQSILIAGCGTSQAAKHALRWPAAQVTGIDFSATSVRCYRGAQAEIQLEQSPGPPASHRAGRRSENELRSDHLHRGSPSSRGARCGAQRSARCAQPGRRSDASHGVCALRTDRHLHAAGILQTDRRPCQR